MDEYQKEQYDALSMVKEHLASLAIRERLKLNSALADYLLFRDKVNTFLDDHFAQICTKNATRTS